MANFVTKKCRELVDMLLKNYRQNVLASRRLWKTVEKLTDECSVKSSMANLDATRVEQTHDGQPSWMGLIDRSMTLSRHARRLDRELQLIEDMMGELATINPEAANVLMARYMDEQRESSENIAAGMGFGRTRLYELSDSGMDELADMTPYILSNRWTDWDDLRMGDCDRVTSLIHTILELLDEEYEAEISGQRSGVRGLLNAEDASGHDLEAADAELQEAGLRVTEAYDGLWRMSRAILGAGREEGEPCEA